MHTQTHTHTSIKVNQEMEGIPKLL